MKYSNIFNYYKGQTPRSDLSLTSTNQLENNVKKAFINILEHSSNELTNNFILHFIKENNNSGYFEYLYEVGSQLYEVKQRAIVVGIAETKEQSGSNNIIENKRTRPDAAIIGDSISILIETKTGLDRLDVPQLEGHKKCFAERQKVDNEIIIITWNEIREFLKSQYKNFSKLNDAKTMFLLEQIEEFFNDNSVGFVNKSNDFFYGLLRTQKAKVLAKQINDYIYNTSTYKHEVEDSHMRSKGGERTDCIGYISNKGSYKFATLTSTRGVCFVLHLGGRRHSLRALEMQKEIDQLLGKQFPGKKPTAGEVYIKLEWVEDLDQIIPFLDEAYVLRLVK